MCTYILRNLSGRIGRRGQRIVGRGGWELVWEQRKWVGRTPVCESACAPVFQSVSQHAASTAAVALAR